MAALGCLSLSKKLYHMNFGFGSEAAIDNLGRRYSAVQQIAELSWT